MTYKFTRHGLGIQHVFIENIQFKFSGLAALNTGNVSDVSEIEWLPWVLDFPIDPAGMSYKNKSDGILN